MPGQTVITADAEGLTNRPSMEGRAIARPNLHHRRRLAESPPSFNGGPGNCPAKLLTTVEPALWILPSMEGRAIARPNDLCCDN